MSKDKDKPSGKKGRLLKLAALLLFVVGTAAGGAFAMVRFGLFGATAAEAHDNTPKLVRKGEEDPYAPPASEKSGEGAAEEITYGEGGEPYRVRYFTFADEFTTNLKDSDALVQCTLAASTRRDGRVLMWLKEHELALRSQMLVDLADTGEDELRSPAGKDRVQKRLTASINRILKQSEGFGGVDQVYFRSLIIQ